MAHTPNENRLDPSVSISWMYEHDSTNVPLAVFANDGRKISARGILIKPNLVTRNHLNGADLVLTRITWHCGVVCGYSCLEICSGQVVNMSERRRRAT